MQANPINVGPRGKEGDGQNRFWPQKRGNPQDERYFWRNEGAFKAHNDSSKPTVVFLLPADVAAFIKDVFNDLPASARVTLITGKADCGAPLEHFTGGLRFDHTHQFVFKGKAIYQSIN